MKRASAVMDKKRVSNIRQNLKKDREPFGHNFEAILSLKEYADKKDPLYVYKINDKRKNLDITPVPSSCLIVKHGKNDNGITHGQNGDHFLSKEFVSYDAKRRRYINSQCLSSLAAEANTIGKNGG